MAAVVRSGGRAVRSSGFYFDGGYSTGGRATVWEEVINAQLVPPGLSAEEESRVLGAEACLWGEVADELFLDQKLWLRASVLAERLWTPHASIAAYCHHKPCSFDNRDLQPRMVKNRCRLGSTRRPRELAGAVGEGATPCTDGRPSENTPPWTGSHQSSLPNAAEGYPTSRPRDLLRGTPPRQAKMTPRRGANSTRRSLSLHRRRRAQTRSPGPRGRAPR